MLFVFAVFVSLEDVHEGIDEFRHILSGLLSSSTGIFGQDAAVGLGGLLHGEILRCAAAINKYQLLL